VIISYIYWCFKRLDQSGLYIYLWCSCNSIHCASYAFWSLLAWCV